MRVGAHCVPAHPLRVGAGRYRCTGYTEQELNKSTHYGYQTLLPSLNEVPPRSRHLRSTHLPARRLVPLLAGVAADVGTVSADSFFRNQYVAQQPRTAPQTPECQGGTERAEMGGGTEHGDIRRRVRGGGTQLALPMAATARMGRVGRRCCLLTGLQPVCGGAAREHLPLTDRRGAGRPKGHRHGTLRHRPPPDVHGHAHPLPLHAADFSLAHLFPDNATLYPPHRQTHT